jgi:hypothetical protein
VIYVNHEKKVMKSGVSSRSYLMEGFLGKKLYAIRTLLGVFHNIKEGIFQSTHHLNKPKTAPEKILRAVFIFTLL